MVKQIAFFALAAFIGITSAIAQSPSICQKFFPGWSLHWACSDQSRKTVYFGRGDEWGGAPDFLMSLEDLSTNDAGNLLQWGTPKLGVRSLVIADKGDAVDLILRRAGPDNSNYNDQNVGIVTGGQNIGTIYWQGYGGSVIPNSGGKSWMPGNGNNGRVASIYAKTCSDQTATSRSGELFLNTSPQNNAGNPVVMMRLNCAGKVMVNFGGTLRALTRRSDGVVVAN
jgi:hypothetical protein